jgi:RNA polymerase sigma-70 factor, ECF subfamily
MNAVAGTFLSTAVMPEGNSLEQEFERHLTECPALAFRVALGVLRNHAEAEDVAQEALLRAYRNFHRLRDHSRFRSWLARTTWNLALDRLRAARRRARREESASEQIALHRADADASREFQRKLEKALDDLPEKLRIVIILAAIEGHDTREMAALLEIPEGTVKSRLYHARKRLAETLQ